MLYERVLQRCDNLPHPLHVLVYPADVSMQLHHKHAMCAYDRIFLRQRLLHPLFVGVVHQALQ